MSARPAPPRPVRTPCVQVCAVDGESGLCLGCYRTLPEIAGWSKLTDAEREALMAELPARRGRIRPEKLGLLG
ncbi:MAG: DUF1289 domain-containing protein [Phenylobacterium sp.]|jgi:predicted Fe-S protein YdhL (DUF1289 family)|uniref:DUF1289 domain-containing protein n=1 Tax=Phenylobacterium sp. TaxID=1871053 RepID=UPI002A359FB9|nr:DUF1289 domain-containing protein [Phenylobacterium sp.]MDX9996434.1 DUF1289 domain-containing protein [Phenylobacterium sp.]